MFGAISDQGLEWDRVVDLLLISYTMSVHRSRRLLILDVPRLLVKSLTGLSSHLAHTANLSQCTDKDDRVLYLLELPLVIPAPSKQWIPRRSRDYAERLNER